MTNIKLSADMAAKLSLQAGQSYQNLGGTEKRAARYHEVLRQLLFGGPTESYQLEKKLGIRHSSLWQVLDSLLKSGYIKVIRTQQFRVGVKRTWAATPKGFRWLWDGSEMLHRRNLRKEDIHRFLIERNELRQETEMILKRQRELSPWASSQIPTLSRAEALRLLPYFVDEEAAFEEYLFKGQSKEDYVLRFLSGHWLLSHYPALEEQAAHLLGIETNITSDEEEEFPEEEFREHLDRYLKAADLESKVKNTVSKWIKDLVKSSNKFAQILTDLAE